VTPCWSRELQGQKLLRRGGGVGDAGDEDLVQGGKEAVKQPRGQICPRETGIECSLHRSTSTPARSEATATGGGSTSKWEMEAGEGLLEGAILFYFETPEKSRRRRRANRRQPRQ
jgi:hypothetical protein